MELVPIGDDSPFALLRMEQSDATDLIQEALGGESLSVKDLDRIKVPAGGGTTWEVATLDGDVATKVIEAVIIQRATRRAYWPYAMEDRPDDDDGRPACASNDGLIGVGDPGGECASCPYNEFQTDIKGGPGKACKETRQLFLLMKDDLLPLTLNVPPGSLANIKAYFLRLLRAQLSPSDVLTKIGLEKVKGGKVDFARMTFEAADRLSPDARQRVREYTAVMAPAMEHAARVEVDEAA